MKFNSLRCLSVVLSYQPREVQLTEILEICKFMSFIKFGNFHSLLPQIIVLYLSLSLPFWYPNTGVLEPAYEQTLGMELIRM